MRISSKRRRRDASPFSFPSSLRQGGGFLRETMALSTSSAASARGQMEKEALLNVRGWIREADYAWKVRVRRKCKRREGNGGRARIDLSECWHEWILTKLVCMYGFMQLRPEVCVCVCLCLSVCVCV